MKENKRWVIVKENSDRIVVQEDKKWVPFAIAAGVAAIAAGVGVAVLLNNRRKAQIEEDWDFEYETADEMDDEIVGEQVDMPDEEDVPVVDEDADLDEEIAAVAAVTAIEEEAIEETLIDEEPEETEAE